MNKKIALILIIFCPFIFCNCDEYKPMNKNEVEKYFLLGRETLLKNENWEENFYFEYRTEKQRIIYTDFGGIIISDITDTTEIYYFDDYMYEYKKELETKTKKNTFDYSHEESYLSIRDDIRDEIKNLIKSEELFVKSGIKSHFYSVNLYINSENCQKSDSLKQFDRANISIIFNGMHDFYLHFDKFQNDVIVEQAQFVFFEYSSSNLIDVILPNDLDSYIYADCIDDVTNSIINR